MTTEPPADLEARVAKLERLCVDMTQRFAKGALDLGEQTSQTQLLLMALEDALKKKVGLTDAEVVASMGVVSHLLTLELEHAETPELKLFRDGRRIVKGLLAQAAEPGPAAGPPAA
jgi:hypothetical protein